MEQTSSIRRLSLPMRLALGIALIVVLSLWAFYIAMQPPMNDLRLMAIFLSITAILSALASFAAYRLGWINRSPSIRWTLLGVCVFSGLLTFLNVWMTAKLMFANQHDLILATVLLVYASGIALVIGYFFFSTMTDRIEELNFAAHSIAAGHLDTRLQVAGRDEIADLAISFNEMAAQLQVAARKQQEAETLRKDLIAWVSHDLQTPLASIRAMVEALADGVVEDLDIQQRYLRTAQRDIDALSLLIDDLFQMAQLDAGGLALDLAYNSLSDLVSDTLESFSELAIRQGITLQGKVDPGCDPVWMDAPRVGRALNNLVGNALRHTPPGGMVEIQAAPAPQGVRIDVSDTGVGISPEDVPFIFERFFRSEKSRNRSMGGAGLGLAITRGIIEAHGGKISVESVPGQTTHFTFSLPGKP